MKLTYTHRIKQISAFICIAVVATLAVNDIVFLHAHELPNGEIIIHAHPYNKDSDSAPLKKHHHSTSEYIAIHHIQLLFPFSFFILPAVLFYCHICQTFFFQRKVRPIYLVRIPGRSPPR